MEVQRIHTVMSGVGVTSDMYVIQCWEYSTSSLLCVLKLSDSLSTLFPDRTPEHRKLLHLPSAALFSETVAILFPT